MAAAPARRAPASPAPSTSPAKSADRRRTIRTAAACSTRSTATFCNDERRPVGRCRRRLDRQLGRSPRAGLGAALSPTRPPRSADRLVVIALALLVVGRARSPCLPGALAPFGA